MSAERRIAVTTVKLLKTQIEEWEKVTPTSTETLCKIESALEEFKTTVNDLKTIIAAELKAIDKLNKTPEKIQEEENAIFNELKQATASFIVLNAKFRELENSFKDAVHRRSLINPSNTNTSFACASTTKLPKIQVPKFSGKVREFLNFKNSFENIVMNLPELNNVQKLHYLQEALEGDASALIRDFPINENSFGEAWSLLLERYENQRSIIKIYFRDLCAIESIKSESGIRELLDKFNAVVRGLKLSEVKACNDNEEKCPFFSFLTYFLASKLDKRTNRDWENSLTDNKDFPTYNKLTKFLQTRSFSVEDQTTIINEDEKKSTLKKQVDKYADKTKKAFVTGKAAKCNLCSEAHYTDQCKELISKSLLDRFELIKERRLCTNCLGANHRTFDCKASSCKTCNGRHHTILHRDVTWKPMAPETKLNESSKHEPSTSNSDNSRKVFASFNSNRKIVILPTAVVQIEIQSRSGFRKYALARALLDQGSQANIISENFVRKHRVTTFKQPDATSISGISDCSISIQFGANIRILSRFSEFAISVEADVMCKIPFTISSTILREIRSKNPGLNFAECDMHHEDVDIILGAEFCELCANDTRILTNNVFIRNTHFGWVISGPYENPTIPANKFCNLTMVALEEQLRKFWHIEEAANTLENSSDDDVCRKHYEKTYSRDIEGRFIVRLPFKPNSGKLGESYSKAVNSLRRVERKVDRETWEAYVEFMNEYEKLGHMEKVISKPSDSYYIPHRAILRPSSTTTKLRVVFNASAKSSTNLSLNDTLLIGPPLQSELMDILIRFRTHAVAFTADVAKMYRQVLIHEDDRDFQRIVWRSHSSAPVETFRLKTVTYGTAPASFLATRCLFVIADEIAETAPEASRAVKFDFYMDDLLTGANTIDAAKSLLLTIHRSLEIGCFPLRKYKSNSPALLSDLDSNLIEKNSLVEFGNPNVVSVLGLKWNSKNDSFSININATPDNSFDKLTKRQMLSEIAATFDPLGILSPVTIRAKILIQDLWREQLTWDEPVPESLRKKFREYYSELSLLKTFSIDRRYTNFSTACDRRLIGFCDASPKAYCAVLYLRFVSSENQIQTSLVCAKTRVAPLKELTIPKLELQAALLLAQLIERVSRELQVIESDIYAFSDSTVTLHWIYGPADKWTVFVKNRVSKISRILPPNRWKYVRTHENPADLATRGTNVRAFLQNDMWVHGPSFLSIADFTTNRDLPPMGNCAIPELRLSRSAATYVALKSVDTELIQRWSSLKKLITVVCCMFKFCNNCKIKTRSGATPVEGIVFSVCERELVLNAIIRMAQTEKFSSEISALKKKLIIPKRSILSSLNPFLDDNEILRVGGRLKNSLLPFNQRHPIILYAKDRFTELLVSDVHECYFHANRSFIVNFLSNKYWFVGGISNAVKKVLYRCKICLLYASQTSTQIMGQLPASRVQPARPFATTGIDFAGPFLSKCTGHRSTKHGKIYAAIFVCFCTRAVHIEVVSDLTVDGFLCCLQRFIARRGVPSLVYSDNATNFTGTQKFTSSDHAKIINDAARKGIDWRFIPPRTPHHGGLWEAAVKSAKHHMTRITQGQALTFEEAVTLLANIESILNSRPLGYKPDSKSWYEIVTPSHFLVGSSLLTPCDVTKDVNISMLKRYSMIQSHIQSFWTQWRKDYLNQLTVRNKWKFPVANLKLNDIVLLKDHLHHPSEWSLGRIANVFPDQDGAVRTVEVQTKNSVKRRSINQLVVLTSAAELNSSAGGETVRSEFTLNQRG